jgi:hypothetical protein
MRVPVGYRCSEWKTCPNSKCLHIRPHLARRLTAHKADYKTCASYYRLCSFSHKLKICELVSKQVAEEEKKKKEAAVATV